MFERVQDLVDYVVDTLGVNAEEVEGDHNINHLGVQIYGNKFIPLSCSEEEVRRRVEEFRRILGR